MTAGPTDLELPRVDPTLALDRRRSKAAAPR